MTLHDLLKVLDPLTYITVVNTNNMKIDSGWVDIENFTCQFNYDVVSVKTIVGCRLLVKVKRTS